MRFLRRFLPPSRPPESSPTPPLLANRALVRRLELNSRRRLAATLAGAYRSQFRGQGMEFSELRPYQPGDDVRLIDWNVTARTGVPHLRQYREERSRTLTLLVDLSPSMAAAKRELLLETTALLAFAAAASGDRVALIAFTDRVEQLILPEGGMRHARRILGELLAHQPQGRTTDLTQAIDTALALNRHPGMVILLSDLHVPLARRRLSELNARHDLIALLLRDPLEQQPKVSGLLRVVDRETGDEQLLDLTSPTERAALSSEWQRNDGELQDRLRKLGIDHTFLLTGESPLPVLLRLFHRRAGRRR